MKIFKKDIRLSVSLIVLVVLTICIIGLGIYYYGIDDTSKHLPALLSSTIAGLFVALIQFLISWYDFRANEKVLSLGIKKILVNRDDRKFYENYIANSSIHIEMMGVTGSRFLDDFADTDSSATENSKVLLRALERGVQVKILLPKESFLMSQDEKTNASKSYPKFKKLITQYSTLKVRFFNHIPTHSIFNVDNECIIGPVFPEVPSKNTPAIYLKNYSQMAKPYITYFEKEWENAEQEY